MSVKKLFCGAPCCCTIAPGTEYVLGPWWLVLILLIVLVSAAVLIVCLWEGVRAARAERRWRRRQERYRRREGDQTSQHPS